MPTHTGPKKIVLLSDGTGNSAAKLMKTNVWRMYEAVDLTAGDQVALYDNGVGTSSFRPLAMLGGAFGWGLKRNVLNLYTFACRNYVDRGHGKPPDAIFAFGFSRGAFTIRVLIGLIESQGLITGVKGRELERQARWAYREYRRQFNPTGGLVAPLRTLRDRLLRVWERQAVYTAASNVRPHVAFVGLWDTVDAYGLPIDEMTRGWDQWVWPLSLGEHARPKRVDKICHVIALDDERHTFHPVLFDESNEPVCTNVTDEKLTQVWFAGVHSNVGGGYPDDSLAHASLRWMAEQAGRHGLRLFEHVRNEWQARSDPNGPIYDSRRGLGSYYRYNPRSIQKLTNDRFADVNVPLPKIHESVFQRIAGGPDDYAPIVLPERYAVVTDTGLLRSDAANPYEHPTQSKSRCADQERIWNLVWWRRIAYFATVILTFLLVVAPFLFGTNGGGVLPWESRALGGTVQLTGEIAPAAARPWIDYYQRFPFQLFVGGGLVLALLTISTRLQRSISEGMRAVWDSIVKKPGQEVTPSAVPDDWVYRLRSHPAYRRFFVLVTQHVFPFVFGVSALLAVVLIVAGTVNRAAFAVASAAGVICRDAAPPVTWDGSPRTVSFSSSDLCRSTGLVLEEGRRYRVEIVLPKSGWSDREIEVSTPAGFGSGEKPLAFVPALPFRRILTAGWFVPMVRVGSHGSEYHALDQGHAEFTPRRSGRLFLFVNDAIGIAPMFKTFYENNRGKAEVTVLMLSPSPLPR